jgi:DNA polymerase III delta prime subunit
MSLLQESKSHVDQVATESLQMMAAVAARASGELKASALGSGALASVNTLTAVSAMQRLDEINFANLSANQVLVREPAIARVVVVDEAGSEQPYYICRAAPVNGVPGLLASYKAPVGRLASLPVGAEFRLPNGKLVEVIERARLRPWEMAEGWDSRDTILESGDLGPVTIESLRALLRQAAAPEQVEDLLSQVLEQAKAAANVFEGIKRNQITKMGLRDQPVLDQYQDEIFRLPLDQRLLILGPPGTGKTTTLIRRLGQKLDASFLSPDEQRVATTASQATGTAHADSWIMFTPTELLKQYLKEAFAREHVPASDMRLKTWQDYRRELGRNTMGILRTANSGGTFTLKEAAATLLPEAIAKPIEWFGEFDIWQRRAYVQQLEVAAQVLCDSQTSDVAALGQRIAALLKQATPTTMPALFTELAAEVDKLQALVSELKASSDAKINGALNLAMNREPQFIAELARLIDQNRVAADADTDEQDDADEDGEDEDPTLPKTGPGAAVTAYMKAVRAQARAQAAKRSISKTSRNAKIIEWLGPRTLSPADRATVGSQLLVLTAARRFVNPIKRYLSGIPTRYRAFRRDSQELQTWYRPEAFPATDLHPLELDLLLLAHLRAAGELLSRPTIARRVEEPFWAALQTVQGLYKHQILVDEATDFSPIQLACMAALAHPQLRSFFACGDFNQRLTTWGSRSLDEMRWVLPDIDVREVSVAYRQSQQLNDLARAIIETLGGADPHVSLPQHVDSNGQKPVLLEGAADVLTAVGWLAERIREIERFLGQLPSTAIFVNAEAEVQGLADALTAELEDSNLQVVACPKGQVMGQDTDVRVFDIQHIKGLEFEAVFFVGLDRLAASQPALFDKYLYVGTTRAATYLGLSCDGGLPPAMEALRPHFAGHWATA